MSSQRMLGTPWAQPNPMRQLGVLTENSAQLLCYVSLTNSSVML